MRSLRPIAMGLLVAVPPVAAQTAAPQSVVRVAPFTAVEVRDGAKVVLRYGPAQRVTFIRGTPELTPLTVARNGRLTIRKCVHPCPRGYVAEIEIVTPAVAGISVSNGGSIRSLGGFPRQRAIGVAVRHGGTIDIRSLAVESVTASVEEGGGILTAPRAALVANVSHGGNVTYWGDPRMNVVSSVQHGGVIAEGDAGDLDKPLSELRATPPDAHAPRPGRTLRRL